MRSYERSAFRAMKNRERSALIQAQTGDELQERAAKRGTPRVLTFAGAVGAVVLGNLLFAVLGLLLYEVAKLF